MPAGFEERAIFNTCWTNLFTSAATQAAINVFAERGRGIWQSTLSDRAHQVQTPAWSIIFIAGNYVGRTCFEAQPAMNASNEFLFLT